MYFFNFELQYLVSLLD